MTAPDERVLRLGVLDRYGVRWSALSIARDVIQNFFDASPDLAGVRVAVEREARRVTVEGPVAFDVELLAYVGATTKTDGRSAGGFGEGFKVAALVLARDHGVTVAAGSADWALTVFFDDVSLGRELCYRVAAVSPRLDGSWVRLDGCPDEVLAAFEGARDLFRHPNNPRFASPVALSADGAAGVYRLPRGAKPEVYYRRQFRGNYRVYEAPALVLACDDVVDALEGDRDRTDLDPSSMARAVAERLAPEALYDCLVEMERTWHSPDTVLVTFLRVAYERKLKFRFPANWVARSEHPSGAQRFATRQGLRLAIGWFREVGMPTAEDYYKADLKTFAPDAAQAQRIECLATLYGALLGQAPPKKDYEVFDDPRAAVLGQHLGKMVIVASKVLRKGRFVEAAGTVLHELAHETGGEDSDTFKRRLVRLGRAVLAKPEAVAEARRAWRRVDRGRIDAVEEAPAEAPVDADALPEVEATVEAPYDPLNDPAGMNVLLAAPPVEALTEEFARRLREAVARSGQGVKLCETWVLTAPAVAERAGLPGVPAIFLGDREVGALLGPARASAGAPWEARDFEGDVLPSVEALVEALAAAKDQATDANGWRPSATAYHQARYPQSRETPRDEVYEQLLPKTGSAGYKFAELWNGGLHRAMRCVLARTAVEGRTVAEVVAEVWAAVERGIEVSRTLRREEPDFEVADPLDADVMAAAQGAAVLAWAQTPDGDMEGAREDFRAVRAIVASAWEQPVLARYRRTMVEHTLNATPLAESSHASDPPTRIDREALARRWKTACARGAAWQAHLDEEGHHMHEAFGWGHGTAWMMTVMAMNDARRKEAQAEEARATAALARSLGRTWRPIAARRGDREALRAVLARLARRAP